MPFADAASAAGFHSIRQFNETIRDVYASTPTEMRRRSKRASRRPFGVVELRLSCREPFDGAASLRFLEARAVPGLEDVSGGTYRRALTLPHGLGIVELTPEVHAVRCVLHLDDLRDLATAVARCRRLLDLDADPQAISEVLGRDEVIGGLVRARPGLRVPGCVHGDELALRAVLGQHVSLRTAQIRTAHLVESFGTPLQQPLGTVTHLFPAGFTTPMRSRPATPAFAAHSVPWVAGTTPAPSPSCNSDGGPGVHTPRSSYGRAQSQ
jgi:AraC family transcriptional regulator of adaptative response / DNA-3-methyladenine glycosylase II